MDFSKLDPNLVVTVATGVLSWLGHKIWSAISSSKQNKILSALKTAGHEAKQLVLAADPDMTAERMIIQLKGVFAIQLAKVGVTEAQRAPYQHLINEGIAAAVTEWMQLHPTPKAVVVPRAVQLAPAK